MGVKISGRGIVDLNGHGECACGGTSVRGSELCGYGIYTGCGKGMGTGHAFKRSGAVAEEPLGFTGKGTGDCGIELYFKWGTAFVEIAQ
ncbi:MAG: hypothetical protein EBY15_10195 [Gammaproteobacteria bacterium]|nr:hypothetical protein [Gammaproteobacteria bacterium]